MERAICAEQSFRDRIDKSSGISWVARSLPGHDNVFFEIISDARKEDGMGSTLHPHAIPL
jgi:hypothetical protein